MRVLVNFLPLLPRGGGLQNALNLWRAIERLGADDHWLGVVRPDFGLSNEAPLHMKVHHSSPGSHWGRLWQESYAIPHLAEGWGADVIWTPMGAGPLRSALPTVIGWHDSSIAYPESIVHRRIGPRNRMGERLRGAVARAAARRAARITVQTSTMRERLARVWDIEEERFVLVPNGPSAFLSKEAPRAEDAPDPPVVLVVAEAKPAKNLEILPEVARLLRRSPATSSVRVVVTVAPEGVDGFTRTLDAAVRAVGPEGALERIGRVAHARLGALYRSAAVVFLPSLLESFSATFVEAMHFGVPLVTSDLDFARDLCGDAAVYVDPLDANDCAMALGRVVRDRTLQHRLRKSGFERVTRFPDWDRRFSLYRQALEGAVEGRRGAHRVSEVGT